MRPAPRDVPVRASAQPPEPPLGLPPAPRASGAAVPALLVAAGRPPTPTGAAEPSALSPPGEAVAFPSGTVPTPSLGAAEADGVTVTLADGPALGVEDAAPVEGGVDGVLGGVACELGAADGAAVGAASAGTST